MNFNYKTAFDRITTAYLNDVLNPWINCACFVGNLLNNDESWAHGRGFFMNIPMLNNENCCWQMRECINKNAEGFYSPLDIVKLETKFLNEIEKYLNTGTSVVRIYANIEGSVKRKDHLPEYEDALYQAMVVTLEELKQIHISKGEDVDNSLSLKKRKLETT